VFQLPGDQALRADGYLGMLNAQSGGLAQEVVSGARGGIIEAFTDLGSKGEGGHQIFFGALSVDVVC